MLSHDKPVRIEAVPLRNDSPDADVEVAAVLVQAASAGDRTTDAYARSMIWGGTDNAPASDLTPVEIEAMSLYDGAKSPDLTMSFAVAPPPLDAVEPAVATATEEPGGMGSVGGTLTAEERARHAALVDALRSELGAEWVEARVALTVLFNSKLGVDEASKAYRKWVKMLREYAGFTSIAELLGPTASAMPAASDAWASAADWAELRADSEMHAFLHPAGKDMQGRQVMWEYGLMRCVKGREKALLRVFTLIWLAVHADLTTLREGVTVVHTVGPDDGKLLWQKTTRSGIAAACAFPLRPQKILVAGIGGAGVAIAKKFMGFTFMVTRAKMLERIHFVSYEDLWSHVPHESIPTYRDICPTFGGYAGIEHPIDWIEQRLRAFAPFDA